jgi:hypothetical protein
MPPQARFSYWIAVYETGRRVPAVEDDARQDGKAVKLVNLSPAANDRLQGPFADVHFAYRKVLGEIEEADGEEPFIANRAIAASGLNITAMIAASFIVAQASL